MVTRHYGNYLPVTMVDGSEPTPEDIRMVARGFLSLGKTRAAAQYFAMAKVQEEKENARESGTPVS